MESSTPRSRQERNKGPRSDKRKRARAYSERSLEYPDELVVQAKVTIQRIDPPIWRQLLVPLALNLAELHEVIQAAFGWTDSHLHQFIIGGLIYGMTYIHIPVDFQNPTDQDFEQFRSVMEQLREVPVHVHCIANYRVSAFFYRYRRDVLGMDETQSRAEMETIWHPEGVWAAFVDR
jgi:hypothetical protein